MVFPIQTSRDSWLIMLKPIVMKFELSMVIEIEVKQWFIKNELVLLIGINLWRYTQSNR